MTLRYGFYFLCIILIGLFFEMAEPLDKDYPEDWFLLSDKKLYLSDYVYYTSEHIIYFLLALVIIKEIPSARLFAIAFCILEVLDCADLWITANGPWFFVGELPITFNVIKVTIFTLLLINYVAYRYSTDSGN